MASVGTGVGSAIASGVGASVMIVTGGVVGATVVTIADGLGVSTWRSRSGSREEEFSIDGGVILSRSTCQVLGAGEGGRGQEIKRVE